VDYKALTHQSANQGKLQEALSWNDKAISENKLDAELYYIRAMILLELNELDNAVTALNRILYLDSRFVMAYIALGNVFQKKGKIADADKHFECALKILSELDAETKVGDVTASRLIDIILSIKELE
jgi:tetratricopeptide (TPR) repeat protein